MDRYGVIIIGAGPAGLFACLELSRNGIGPILLIEQGKDVGERSKRTGSDLLCGWGGAGAFSDGKLTLSPDVGGFLSEIISRGEVERLLKEADDVFVSFGAPAKTYNPPQHVLDQLEMQAKLAQMEFVFSPIRHMGTENCLKVLMNMREYLKDKVDVVIETRVDQILVESGIAKGVRLASGETIYAEYVVCAPGRVGASWMKKEAARLGLTAVANPVDLGVRVEVPAVVMQKLTDQVYEAKLIYYSQTDDRVRTFCMNPFGEVVAEVVDGMVSVNGHSYAEKRSENTNFALLVSSRFTEPFDDPIGYGRAILSLANMLGKGIIVQRLGDLLAGRRTTKRRLSRCITRPTLPEATPGDLSFIFPYRHMKNFIEMLQAMENIAPGVYSRHTLLYGVEVKFYSHRIQLNYELESEANNLFIAGDGSGLTRGLIQASVSGMIAARAIIKRHILH
ncbi:MAG: FAD-dependent oxidoreductase [Pseudomonadota bacterium]